MQLVKNLLEEISHLQLNISGSLLFMDYILFKESYSLEENIKSILLDLTKLEQIDCSGLAMILLLQDYANCRNIEVSVVNSLHDKVSNLISIANLPDKVKIIESTQSAVVELID